LWYFSRSQNKMGKADFSHSASQYYSYYCFVFLIVDPVLCNFLPINEYVIREIIDILVVLL